MGRGVNSCIQWGRRGDWQRIHDTKVETHESRRPAPRGDEEAGRQGREAETRSGSMEAIVRPAIEKLESTMPRTFWDTCRPALDFTSDERTFLQRGTFQIQ